MNRVAVAFMLVLAGGCVALGQAAALPAIWIGTWELVPKESAFGPVWGPGLPDGLTIANQSFRIEDVAGEMKVTGDTIFTNGTTTHDDFHGVLDGKETVLAPGVTISFTRTGDTILDVIGKVNNDASNYINASHFVFSAGGKTLTETKTQTRREVVPDGADQTEGAIVRSSVSVLVFRKLS